MKESRIIYVDVDGILFKTGNGNMNDIINPTPIQENIDKINKLYDEGNCIVIWTARGQLSSVDLYDITKSQLHQYGIKHHQLRCDKPYFDELIDDRTRDKP